MLSSFTEEIIFSKYPDYFSNVYNNGLIMGGFINLEPNNPCMKSFLNSNSFANLIKPIICFKGSCIDLILSNRKYSFQYKKPYETGHVIIIL